MSDKQFQDESFEGARFRSEDEVPLVVLYASVSSQLAKPVRRADHVGLWLITGIRAWLTFKPGSRPRRVIWDIVTGLGRLVRRNPRVTAATKFVVRRLPSNIQGRLWAAVSNVHPVTDAVVPRQIADLSPGGREIYTLLKTAMDDRRQAL